MSARRDVALVMTEFRYSDRQACRLLDLDRSSYRYEARTGRNIELREELILLARQKPRYSTEQAPAQSQRQALISPVPAAASGGTAAEAETARAQCPGEGDAGGAESGMGA